MTDKEKENIITLRKMGVGYRAIAAALGLSRDLVRNYCKSKGLDGYGIDIYKRHEEEIIEEENKIKCKNCGVPVEQPKTGRRKIYCSPECKKEWNKNHHIKYSHTCLYCGKDFESDASKASFCSHKCYIRSRFWREEDIKMVVECLEKEEPIPNAPGWIKELVNGKSIKDE